MAGWYFQLLRVDHYTITGKVTNSKQKQLKKIIALDANHIVVEGEEKTYYIQFFADEAESLKAAAQKKGRIKKGD